MCCFNLMYVFIVLVTFGNWVVAYWEKADHSFYLIVNLVFFPPRFLEWEFLSDCAFPDIRLPV